MITSLIKPVSFLHVRGTYDPVPTVVVMNCALGLAGDETLNTLR